MTCGTANEIRTQWDHLGETLLPTIERRIDGVTGAMLDTVHAYDAAGRLLSTDGPLPGSDDAAYNRYDVHGRRTWEIGPKGANGTRNATRTVYRDADDRVLYVETGTIPDQNSTALSVLARTDFTYDARRNRIREAVSGAPAPGQSLTLQAVVDRSWDNEARRLPGAAHEPRLAARGRLHAGHRRHARPGPDHPQRI